MAPRQFIDFLTWAEAHHQELRDFYAARAEEASRPEVKTLLQYMTRHEDILRQLIAEYEEGAPDDILEMWFKVSPDLKAVKHPDEIGLRADMSVNEVIDKALELDDSLIEVYKALQREVMTEEVGAAIADLLDQEEREEVKLMRTQLVD